MALESARTAQFGEGWSALATAAEADGSAHHPLIVRLTAPNPLARDLADAVHALVMLHGRQPGVLDHAMARNAQPAWSGWFEAAVESFVAERALLAKLASAAGPLPSTPGQAESEAAIIAQRHALETLAKSDRSGCAIGAAIAMVIEWRVIRRLLDAAAERFGVATRVCVLPIESETATIVASALEKPATERAMAFGVQQLLAQHRGLWDLLEARASARNHA